MLLHRRGASNIFYFIFILNFSLTSQHCGLWQNHGLKCKLTCNYLNANKKEMNRQKIMVFMKTLVHSHWLTRLTGLTMLLISNQETCLLFFRNSIQGVCCFYYFSMWFIVLTECCSGIVTSCMMQFLEHAKSTIDKSR